MMKMKMMSMRMKKMMMMKLTRRSQNFLQPEKMINVFEKKMSPVVAAINNLVQQFLPVESKDFDIEKYTARLRNDLETKYKVDESWSQDYFTMTCPAVKF